MPAGDQCNIADTAWQYCLGSPSGHRPSSPGLGFATSPARVGL
jgi:hypothetical protein